MALPHRKRVGYEEICSPKAPMPTRRCMCAAHEGNVSREGTTVTSLLHQSLFGSSLESLSQLVVYSASKASGSSEYFLLLF
ncbi:hypothetical protein E2C01_043361 [Portunus trituberculatus]|uniref:Uncharacterized protein n=1 Tax=Portunus trituberculatus TaxID=210409 RepID=A0A5B7FZC5_PORTR|nr:hypothetical protein [Portunus trituberculatus]